MQILKSQFPDQLLAQIHIQNGLCHSSDFPHTYRSKPLKFCIMTASASVSWTMKDFVSLTIFKVVMVPGRIKVKLIVVYTLSKFLPDKLQSPSKLTLLSHLSVLCVCMCMLDSSNHKGQCVHHKLCSLLHCEEAWPHLLAAAKHGGRG